MLAQIYTHTPKILRKKYALWNYFLSARGNVFPPWGCGFRRAWRTDRVSQSSAGQGWTPAELSRQWRPNPGWMIDWLTPPLTVTDGPCQATALNFLSSLKNRRLERHLLESAEKKRLTGSPCSDLWLLNFMFSALNNDNVTNWAEPWMQKELSHSHCSYDECCLNTPGYCDPHLSCLLL